MTNPVTPDATETAAVTPETPEVPQAHTKADLPDWARAELDEARNEAKRYRLEKNEALANAKTIVEAEYANKLTEAASTYSELEVKFAQKSDRVAKLEAVINAGIPSDVVLDVANLVQGSTEDEIAASVESIKGIFSRDPKRPPLVDPTQGSTPPLPLNGDPLLNALKDKLGISH